jgi:hypothetical protein
VQRADRLTLILDEGNEAALGAAALDLVARGLDPLYASDEDELALLAREHRSRVAALVLPGTLPLERIDAVWARLGPALRGCTATVVIVAPPRERARLGGLRARGFRWVVFAPYDAAELHFAVTAALSSGDALEPRSGLRVPIHLPARVRWGDREQDGEVRNLSVGGAFVALADPPAVGETLELGFPIGERPLRAVAVVRHRREAATPGREPGIGVAFSGLAADEGRLLHAFVRERIDCFRL